MAADNDRPCLTKEQARAKWPKDWLYWHTANRCWDNQKVGSVNRAHYRTVAGPTRKATVTPDEIDKTQYQMEAEKRLATCCWPPAVKFIPWEIRINGALNAKP